MNEDTLLRAERAEIESLKKFINYHTTVLVLVAIVVAGVGMVMVNRLRTTPADVYAVVREIKKDQMTREEIKAIIADTAPWANDKQEWEVWRESVDSRLERILKMK